MFFNNLNQPLLVYFMLFNNFLVFFEAEFCAENDGKIYF